MPRVEWDPENESYKEFKQRRSKSHGVSGMGQKKEKAMVKLIKQSSEKNL